MKYRSKPSTLEATQWFPGREVPGVQFSKDVRFLADGLPFVITAHGQRAFLDPGDWVAEEPGGRGNYPIKPDIFATRWEAADG
jgi:hypothetical protein